MWHFGRFIPRISEKFMCLVQIYVESFILFYLLIFFSF